jgi:hypothetical protein
MKVKVNCLWNIMYHYEPGCPVLKVTMPVQVRASSFDEAKLKVDTFLQGLEHADKVKCNGITLAGGAVLE